MMSTVYLEARGLDCRTLDLAGDDLMAAVEHLWSAPNGVLLAHTAGAVVWGRVTAGRWDWATAAKLPVAALMRSDALLSLRLFNREQELRVWRSDPGLVACLLKEGAEADYSRHFVAWQEQSYGLVDLPQPVPTFLATVTEARDRSRPAPPRWLRVRHYLELDPDTGLLRLAEHRLLALQTHRDGGTDVTANS